MLPLLLGIPLLFHSLVTPRHSECQLSASRLGLECVLLHQGGNPGSTSRRQGTKRQGLEALFKLCWSLGYPDSGKTCLMVCRFTECSQS